jgi:hypothetical protein
MPSKWTPRLSIEISEEHYKKLAELIPHGMKVKVFTALIEDLIDILESPEGQKFLAGILTRNLRLRHIMKGL